MEILLATTNQGKIVELTALLVRIPLRKPIRHASHTRDSTDNIIVRCVLEDGTEGHGEGVPREYVTGETAESACWRTWLAIHAAPREEVPNRVKK